MKHYNPSITERANRIFNLKNGDQMPDDIDGPVAVIPITPTLSICRIRNSAGTLYTVPTDKDFYIHRVALSYDKTVADTGSTISISCTIAGVSTIILQSACITLTAERDTVWADFTHPIKVDRGTSVVFNVSGTFTAVTAQLMGQTEEVSRT